jgi:fructokinase
MTTIAVIGEAVADAIVQDCGPAEHSSTELRLRVLPGGGPVNTAVALSRLGTPTQFLGRLAGGPIGQLLQRHLAESHVDLSSSVRASEQPTLAIASLGSDGQATYDFYLEDTADWQWTTDELTAWDPRDTVALHAASLALTQPPGATLIEGLLARVRPHTTVSIDPNVRTSVVPTRFYRDAWSRWARLADILRLSQDDLDVLMPGVSLADACARLHEAGTALVVVTLGPGGAHASLLGQTVDVPAHDVTVVDTVGAGDSFSAGLLHWLHAADALGGRMSSLAMSDLVDALRFASLVAALTCERAGADPPRSHELDAVRLDGLSAPRRRN